MKRFALILALVLMIAMPTIAQRNALDKIAPDLREEMSRKDSHDNYSIIIVMSDQYDQLQMSKQIQHLGKSERRTFVIQELQAFSKANQHDLLLLLNEAAKTNAVAYFNNGNIVVNQEGTLQIVDMTGRMIYQGDAKHGVSTNEPALGMYVLRLITANDMKT